MMIEIKKTPVDITQYKIDDLESEVSMLGYKIEVSENIINDARSTGEKHKTPRSIEFNTNIYKIELGCIKDYIKKYTAAVAKLEEVRSLPEHVVKYNTSLIINDKTLKCESHDNEDDADAAIEAYAYEIDNGIVVVTGADNSRKIIYLDICPDKRCFTS